MELQPPQKPAMEVSVLFAQLDNERNFLAESQKLLSKIEYDVDIQSIIIEQKETKISLAEVLENHQTILTNLTALKKNLAANKIIAEEQLRENVAVIERLVSLGSAITNHKLDIEKLQNIIDPKAQEAHTHLKQEVGALKQEITFFKRIGLGIVSLALLYWLWICAHKA